MPCPQCQAQTKQGNRCRLKACKFSPFCHHHTPLQVKPSDIEGAGEGLFAKRDIPANTIVARYTMGEALNQQQFRNRYPNGRATHVWQHPDGTYYDAINVKKTVAGKANRARNPNSKMTATVFRDVIHFLCCCGELWLLLGPGNTATRVTHRFSATSDPAGPGYSMVGRLLEAFWTPPSKQTQAHL